MRAGAYFIGFVRMLFSLGLYGGGIFAVAVFLGVGVWQDYFGIRRAANPIFKAWVGADMPPELPWFFIATAFVVIAFFRLVHRHVMWEAVLPRLRFSNPRGVPSPLRIRVFYPDQANPEWERVEWENIEIGMVEVMNSPRARVGGLDAKDAWITATFENLVTKEKKEVRYCRWEETPSPEMTRVIRGAFQGIGQSGICGRYRRTAYGTGLIFAFSKATAWFLALMATRKKSRVGPIRNLNSGPT